jgi:hypothetical protein
VSAAITESGWADDRMMIAYNAIWEVMRDNKAAGVESEFLAVLRAIEQADKLLLEARAEA